MLHNRIACQGYSSNVIPLFPFTRYQRGHAAYREKTRHSIAMAHLQSKHRANKRNAGAKTVTKRNNEACGGEIHRHVMPYAVGVKAFKDALMKRVCDPTLRFLSDDLSSVPQSYSAGVASFFRAASVSRLYTYDHRSDTSDHRRDTSNSDHLSKWSHLPRLSFHLRLRCRR